MSWGGGYVTDVEYTAHYFVSQSPAMMGLACLLNGFAVDPPWEARRLHYLELGCGRGVNATVLAAANPGWLVTGIDFTPGAIADARRLAAEAGLENVRFIEADLAHFAGSATAASLPEADIVSAHGVWSWVADPVRDGIVRLVADKLRAGGMFHLSYNALPAQQGLLGMQRVIREAGQRLAGASDKRVVAGLEMAQALAAAGAAHLTSTAIVRDLLGDLSGRGTAYLSHEYMNEHWRPSFHADVAAALAPAKLGYAGSARLMENFVPLMLTPAQQALHDRFDDPLMRQLVIDCCINRMLRHDVYVRGTTRLSDAGRDAALARIQLALAVPPEAFRYVLELPAGEGTLPEATYRPMVEALSQRPRSLGELFALSGHGSNLGELAMVLAGTYQAVVAADPQAGPSERIHRFHHAMAARAAGPATLNEATAMASLRLGTGIPARAAEVLMAAHAGSEGAVPDPARVAAAMIPRAAPAQQEELAGTLAMVLRDRLDVWRRLGVV